MFAMKEIKSQTNLRSSNLARKTAKSVRCECIDRQVAPLHAIAPCPPKLSGTGTSMEDCKKNALSTVPKSCWERYVCHQSPHFPSNPSPIPL